MINSSLTFIALVLLTNANLSMPRETGPDNLLATLNNKAKEARFKDYQRPQPEYDPFPLNCLLFKDVGCDVECFALTKAFGLLGGGICNKDNVCFCSYAADPTFVGSWKEKFSSSEELLNKIMYDKTLFHDIDKILNTPFSTGLEIKEKLKEKLPTQYDQIKVIDSRPAAKMSPSLNEVNTKEIELYVDNILSEELKYSNKELLTMNVKESLNGALNEMKGDSKKLTLFVSGIRQFENKLMNDVVDSFIKNNRIELTEEATNNQISNVADAISKSIINKLIAKVEKTTFQYYVSWIGERFTYVFSLGFLSNKPIITNDMEEAFKIPKFFTLPSKVDRKIFKTGAAINDRTWRGDNYKLRYQRDETGENIKLTWIKKPVVVSILKIGQKPESVSQNWIFGDVRVYMARTAQIQKMENWDFGTTTNEFQKFFYANEDAYTKRRWGKETDPEVLKKHKHYITQWCMDNKYLISNLYCDILEL